MSAADSGMRGGQPSTTHPIAGPWLSPKVVTRNRWPNVLNDMAHASVRCGSPRGLAGQTEASEARHASFSDPIADALVDRRVGRGALRRDAERDHQGARGAAMGDHHHRIPVEIVVPGAHARGELLVALPAGWH